MKNFEKYIDKISDDYCDEHGTSYCFITAINSGKCFDCTVSCSDCFKRWALEEVKEEGGEE